MVYAWFLSISYFVFLEGFKRARQSDSPFWFWFPEFGSRACGRAFVMAMHISFSLSHSHRYYWDNNAARGCNAVPCQRGKSSYRPPPPHLMMLLHSPPPPFKCYVCLHGTRLHVHVCQRHWLRTNMQPRHALFKAPLRPPHTHTHTYVHTRTDRLRCYSPRALAGGAGHAIFSEALPWPLH